MRVVILGTIYWFHGVETDQNNPHCNEKVIVLAFKSTEQELYFLCARDRENVVLQVGIIA